MRDVNISVAAFDGDPIHNELGSRLETTFHLFDGIYTHESKVGYWSNIAREDQAILLEDANVEGCNRSVEMHIPSLKNFVYSPIRQRGLELLSIQANQVGVDYGCMWGNLLLAAAGKCKLMVGVDITEDHLRFVRHRMQEENVGNVLLVNHDLTTELDLSGAFDFSIVNGVLEWIPYRADQDVEIRPASARPREMQLTFLRNVYRNLKSGGKLYLAIENRYDYQYFLWKPDVHTGLMYTAFAPRFIADAISRAASGHAYRNHIYSCRELGSILREAGFAHVDFYCAFPSYRYPCQILPLQRQAPERVRSNYVKAPTDSAAKHVFRRFRDGLDDLVYNKLGLRALAPAFILICKK